jgi:DNA-binding MarR family transcriptional regulator
MRERSGEIGLNSMLNKILNLYESFIVFSEAHEKALNQFAMQNDYMDIWEKKLLLSEVHVIDCIGKNHLPNATFIAREMDMTKGAISKITTKLLEKKLIVANHLGSNKRELYYTLTGQGKKIFEIHEKFHDIENKGLIDILNKYSQDQWNTIGSFIDQCNRYFNERSSPAFSSGGGENGSDRPAEKKEPGD